MKYVIISDLHLGVKGNISNNFHLDEKVFHRYLERTVAEAQLILAGDVFELWEDLLEPTGDGLPSLKERIQRRLTHIIDSWSFGPMLIQHPNIHLVSGNHDSYLRYDQYFPQKRVDERLIFDEGPYHVLVAHGHQGDVFNRDRSIFSCLVCCALQTKSTIEDLTDENLDQNIQSLSDCFSTNDTKITKYAFVVARECGFDVVVYGHTHHPLFVEKDQHYYINTGCVADRLETIDECVIDGPVALLQSHNLVTGQTQLVGSIQRSTSV
jgi:predicted phosphodiesterase